MTCFQNRHTYRSSSPRFNPLFAPLTQWNSFIILLFHFLIRFQRSWRTTDLHYIHIYERNIYIAGKESAGVIQAVFQWFAEVVDKTRTAYLIVFLRVFFTWNSAGVRGLARRYASLLSHSLRLMLKSMYLNWLRENQWLARLYPISKDK